MNRLMLALLTIVGIGCAGPEGATAPNENTGESAEAITLTGYCALTQTSPTGPTVYSGVCVGGSSCSSDRNSIATQRWAIDAVHCPTRISSSPAPLSCQPVNLSATCDASCTIDSQCAVSSSSTTIHKYKCCPAGGPTNTCKDVTASGGACPPIY